MRQSGSQGSQWNQGCEVAEKKLQESDVVQKQVTAAALLVTVLLQLRKSRLPHHSCSTGTENSCSLEGIGHSAAGSEIEDCQKQTAEHLTGCQQRRLTDVLQAQAEEAGLPTGLLGVQTGCQQEPPTGNKEQESAWTTD